jgi:hypothetical protein
MVMDSLNEDMVDVLELREKQLTEMIRMLQKKRRDVRAAITRLKAETLQPVPVAEDYSVSSVAEAMEISRVNVSGGNNPVCTCRPEGLRFHKATCPLRVG